MLKNILVLLIMLGLGGAGYVYYNSQVKPTGVSIASDVSTGTVSTGDVMTGTQVQLPTINTGVSATGMTPTHIIAANSLMWRKGSKAWWFHTGTIAINSWSMIISGNTIVAWVFTLDMSSIQLLDIQDEWFETEIKEGLFEASKYPITTFEIAGMSMSGDQQVVEWSLTIKGISNPIRIPLTSLVVTNNNVTVSAEFAIERSKRGLTKRAGIVNEYLEFTLVLTANKI